MDGQILYPKGDKSTIPKNKENLSPPDPRRPLFSIPTQNDVVIPVTVKRARDEVKDLKFRVDNVIPGLDNESLKTTKFKVVEEKSGKTKKLIPDIYVKPRRNWYLDWLSFVMLWFLSFCWKIKKPEPMSSHFESQIEVEKLKKEFATAIERGDEKRSSEIGSQLAKLYKTKSRK